MSVCERSNLGRVMRSIIRMNGDCCCTTNDFHRTIENNWCRELVDTTPESLSPSQSAQAARAQWPRKMGAFRKFYATIFHFVRPNTNFTNFTFYACGVESLAANLWCQLQRMHFMCEQYCERCAVWILELFCVCVCAGCVCVCVAKWDTEYVFVLIALPLQFRPITAMLGSFLCVCMWVCPVPTFWPLRNSLTFDISILNYTRFGAPKYGGSTFTRTQATSLWEYIKYANVFLSVSRKVPCVKMWCVFNRKYLWLMWFDWNDHCIDEKLQVSRWHWFQGHYNRAPTSRDIVDWNSSGSLRMLLCGWPTD